MNYIDIWNKIVSLHKNHFYDEEFKLQKLWEEIFKEFFNYSSFFDEIVSHTKTQIGSTERVIPDIILRKNNKDIAIIELKKCVPLSLSYKNQLFSYLKQLKLEVGILICDKIYLFLYDYTKDDTKQKQIVIEMVENNVLGEKFVELLNKNNFSIDAYKNFLNDNTKIEEEYENIKKITNADFIKDLLKNFYKENGYSEVSVNKFLNETQIDINNKNTISSINSNYNYITRREIKTAEYPQVYQKKENFEKLGKNDAIMLCLKNGINVSKHNSTYACIEYKGGLFKANVEPIHLNNDWTILLDDCHNRLLHILRIKANALVNNKFKIRKDNGRIVLHINQSFVDEHPQEKIRNDFFQYKEKTLTY